MGIAPDFSTFSPEGISNWTLEQGIEEIATYVNKMSPEQIGVAIRSLIEKRSPDWKSKTIQIVENLSDLQQLESIGKNLSIEQAQAIIERSRNWDSRQQQMRLLPIFVGMNHQIFSELLLNLTPQQLDILKQESMTEPIQHHLTLLIHEISSQLNQYGEDLFSFEKEILQLNLADITYDDIQAIQNKIEELKKLYLTVLNKTKKALAIAWNTNRPELVDKLSSLKENCQKACKNVIGVPGIHAVPSSGLYLILEKHLNGIYGDANNPQDIEALKDDEPAVEALVKFSIWYLKDYWEVGLLPSIQSPEQLELDPKLYSEKERVNYREKLFAEVEYHLQKLDLITVKDLKNAAIYSKKGLTNFIKAKLET